MLELFAGKNKTALREKGKLALINGLKQKEHEYSHKWEWIFKVIFPKLQREELKQFI